VSAKHGLRYGAITVAVSALISYFLTGDPLIIVSVVLSLGSIGLALGWRSLMVTVLSALCF